MPPHLRVFPSEPAEKLVDAKKPAAFFLFFFFFFVALRQKTHTTESDVLFALLRFRCKWSKPLFPILANSCICAYNVYLRWGGEGAKIRPKKKKRLPLSSSHTWLKQEFGLIFTSLSLLINTARSSVVPFPFLCFFLSLEFFLLALLTSPVAH